MSMTHPKRTAFEQFARVAKALAHPHRLELLEALAQGERSVEGLAQYASLTVGNASQHLQLLRRAGLAAARKDGKNVYYSLAGADVVELVAALRRSAERGLAEIDKLVHSYFHARDALEPVGHDELLGRLRSGLVTLLDVRPADEFAAGHIAGAINIPLAELGRRLRGLPKRREVVAYCRGPYCVLAFEAVATLRKRGFKARRLEDGYPEWSAAGRPVERAATG